MDIWNNRHPSGCFSHAKNIPLSMIPETIAQPKGGEPE